MNSFDEVFEHVKRYCLEKGQIPEVAVKLWIDALHPVDLSGTDAVFTIQSDFQRSVILSNYEPLLKEAFRNILGFDVNLVIRIEEEFEPEPTQTESTGSEDLALRNQQLEKSFEGANYEYTFSTFIVGRSNEFAYAACTAVAKEPGKSYNPLFIYGGVGLGKTHLMHSIAHYILSYNPDYKIIYTTTETFSNELISAIKNKTQEAFKDKYRNIDMLLIDDIQFIAGKDSTMEEFFHTFNTLYENKKQIVISSDKPPKDIVGVEDRLISRFKVGLTVDVQPPDYETRVAILVKRAELEHINIEVDALHYVADHISSNIRELEGALRQIYNFSRLKHADRIDTDLAREALKDIIAPDEARPITPEVIIETVTEHYNYKVTKDDILGKNRSRDISYPRQICMYLCEKYTGLSLAAIGAALGNKDHTTVLHGIKKIKTDLEKDEQLRSTIDIITKKLNPPK